MTRFFFIIIFLLQLAGCNGIFKKTVSIVELTSKLEVGPKVHGPLLLVADAKPLSLDNLTKTKINSNYIISEPLISGDTVYSINNKANLSAFSITSNKALWSKNIDDRTKDQNFMDGGIILDNDRIIATFGSRFLVMLNTRSGNEILRKEFPDLIKTKPVMLNHNVVLVQTVSNHLIAYDINASKMVWAHELPSEAIASSFSQSPIIYKDGVIVFNNNGSISYLTAKLGQELWTLNLSKNEIEIAEYESSAFQCSPVFKDEFMYVATSAGELSKIDVTKGKILWKIKAEDVHSLSINQNNLLVTNNARQVALLNADNGQVKWTANLYLAKDKKNAATVNFSPFIAQASLMSKQGNLLKPNLSLNVATSNSALYSYHYSGELNQEPVLVKLPKNIIYQVNKNGIIYLFDRSNMYMFK